MLKNAHKRAILVGSFSNLQANHLHHFVCLTNLNEIFTGGTPKCLPNLNPGVKLINPGLPVRDTDIKQTNKAPGLPQYNLT